MLALGDLQLEGDRAANDFVGGRLVHAAGVVVARPDAGHVSAGWHVVRLARERIEHLDPWPVERGVLGVVARLVDAPLTDLLRVQTGRGIENRDAVAHQLAMGDHRQLDGLDLVGINRTALVGGHQVGDAEHRDGVDGLEAREPGTVGAVAHVPIRSDAGRLGGAAALKRNLARGGDLLQGAGGPDLLELD